MTTTTDRPDCFGTCPMLSPSSRAENCCHDCGHLGICGIPEPVETPEQPKTPVERVETTLEAGRVMRYHAVPSVAPQNVAHHSWGVAVLCLFLTEGQVSSTLMTEALMHDAAEYFTGDVPFTVKRDRKDVKQVFDDLEDEARLRWLLVPPQRLSDREKSLLKLADTLEGFIWCTKTETRGPVSDRWCEAFRNAVKKFSTILAIAEISRAVKLYQQFGGKL